MPVWDLSAWSHPGGPFVQAAGLCGSVRHGWLAKGSHGAMLDAGTDPEARARETAARIGAKVENSSTVARANAKAHALLNGAAPLGNRALLKLGMRGRRGAKGDGASSPPGGHQVGQTSAHAEERL